MLLLISTLPIVTSYDIDKRKKDFLSKQNNSLLLFTVGMIYGKIIYHGEEDVDGYYGKCYNFTPINVNYIRIYWIIGEGFHIENGEVCDNPCYIPKELWHGFINNNYMFLWLLIAY